MFRVFQDFTPEKKPVGRGGKKAATAGRGKKKVDNPFFIFFSLEYFFPLMALINHEYKAHKRNILFGLYFSENGKEKNHVFFFFNA